MIGPLKDMAYTYEYRKSLHQYELLFQMKRHDDLSCLQYFYFRKSYMIRHIALELGNRWIQMLWVWYVCQTHVSLSFVGLTCLLDSWYLGLGLLPSPNSLGLTCLSDPLYLGLNWLPDPSFLVSDPCYFRLGWLPSPSDLGLVYFPNYFGFYWLPSPSLLGLACLPYSCYIGLGWLRSSSSLGLAIRFMLF
jgi:hypothetical protein